MVEYWDPIVRGPFFGGLFLGAICGLIGTLALFGRQILISEALAHALYPGVLLALLFSVPLSGIFILLFFVGCFAQTLIRYWYCRMSKDAAMCLLLALSFTVGGLLVSYLQQVYPRLAQAADQFFLGHIASLHDRDAVGLGIFFSLLLLLIWRLRHHMQHYLFDPTHCALFSPLARRIPQLFHLLIVLSVVLGIRLMGVALVTALMVGPGLIAYTFAQSFAAALLTGAISGAFASALGISFAMWCEAQLGYTVPIGSVIVLFVLFGVLLARLLSPQASPFYSLKRRWSFALRREQDHLLKRLWKGERITYAFHGFLLAWYGWVEKKSGYYQLTKRGQYRAQKIVRWHRLWELYLVQQMHYQPDAVHYCAEEIEHVLTPELEQQLAQELHYPTLDPHQQTIPEDAL